MALDPRLLELVGPRVGLVRSLTPVPRGGNEPCPPHLYQAFLSHFDFRHAPARDRAAGGKGTTAEEAQASALGEALERYCAAHVDPRGIRRASFAELGDAALPPTEFVLYSESQYRRPDWPYPRFDPAAVIGWKQARELPGNGEVWVPASLVYLHRSLPPQEAFCLASSNGLAAGPDVAAAILGGLCELVERDAFLINWMNRLPAPEVELAGIGGVEEAVARHYARFDVTLRVFAITTDLQVAAMMAVAADRPGRGPAALVGLGCHPSPRLALRRALFEICQIHPSEVRRFHERPPPVRPQRYEEVRTLEDHAAFLGVPERRHELAFLLDSGRRVRLADLPDDGQAKTEDLLDGVLARLAAAGCRALYADLTTPDLLPYPVRVVRTLATGLQPMHFGHGEERLGGRRLYEVPARLGHRAAPTTEADLNPCPHPLP